MKIRIKPRYVVQLAVFATLIFLSLSHMKYGIEKAASIDAYCPYGAAESLLTKITTGNYLNRIWTSSFILMIITIIVTFFLGRVFCSHMCPLGAIQEWLRVLGRKIGIHKDLELPSSMDKYLRYLKYLVLALTVWLSYRLGDLFFRDYDPYNALMHFGNEFEEKVWAYSILGVVVLSALFAKNLWCRYLCPMGASLAIIKKISMFSIVRDSMTCISCGKCDSVCPAGLNIKDAAVVKSADCISCLNCADDCPKSSLSAKIFGYTIRKGVFVWLAILTFFIPLAVIMVTPLWQTKSPSNIIDQQGKIDIANIRGSNTLKNVIETTGVPLEIFIKELGLPADVDTSLMLKNIGAAYGIKNDSNEIIETEDFREVISQNAKSSQ